MMCLISKLHLSEEEPPALYESGKTSQFSIHKITHCCCSMPGINITATAGSHDLLKQMTMPPNCRYRPHTFIALLCCNQHGRRSGWRIVLLIGPVSSAIHNASASIPMSRVIYVPLLPWVLIVSSFVISQMGW